MATNYPAGSDNFTAVAPDDLTSDTIGGRTHSAILNDMGDAVEAVQAELGTDPSGSAATVSARLDGIEAGTRLGTGSVGATQLADNAVDTAAIQDGAVTSAKIADGTITAAQIAANAVGASELADNAVDAAAIAAGVITNSHISASAAIDGSKIVGIGNLLTPNQAGCVSGFDSNGSIAYSTPAPGSFTVTGPWTYILASTVPVTPGDTYTCHAELTVTGGSHAYAIMFFRTAGGADITSFDGNVIPAGSSGVSKVSAVAPSNAAYALFVVYDSGSTASVVASRVGLWKGSGGRWAMPGTPIVGLSETASNGATHLSGTGSPEGVVTAAPGSTWLQTSGAATKTGILSWRKETGTGNTGWVAEGALADTGSRDVSGELASGATGLLRVRRIGNTVTLTSLVLNSTTNGMWTVPSGFRPIDSGNDRSFAIAQRNGTSGAVVYGPAGANVIDMSADMKGYGGVWLVWSWLTTNAWPASLPGVAA